VNLPQEGTIFSGDELQVGTSGFAKVMLVDGHRLQLDAGTKVNIQKTDKAVIVQVRSGNLGFNAATNSQQLRIAIGPYEFVPAAGAAGNVAYVGKDTLGLRATKGNVSVQHASRPSFTVAQGQERIISFDGQSSQPLAQLASIVPGPIPDAPPVPVPQGRGAPAPTTTPAGRSLTTTGWVAILATIGGAAAAIAVLATRGNNEEDVNSKLQQQKLLQSAQAIAASAQAASTAATSAANVSGQAAAVNALPAATRTQFTTLQGQASAQQQAIAATQATITNLVNQIQNTTDQNALPGLTAQLVTAQQTLNTQIAALNGTINSINSLLNQNQGTTGVPPGNLPQAPSAPPVSASASIPQ